METIARLRLRGKPQHRAEILWSPTARAKGFGIESPCASIILSADVNAALDELCIEVVLSSLIHWAFLGDITSALLEEGIGLTAIAQVLGEAMPAVTGKRARHGAADLPRKRYNFIR